MKMSCTHGCILEKVKSEQWREVSSKQTRKKLIEEVRISLFSVEDGPFKFFKNITDVKDRLVKIRVTTNSGATGHVMSETLRANQGWEGEDDSFQHN